MSEEHVHDGVQSETDPTPKEPAGSPKAGNGASADEAVTSPGSKASGDSGKGSDGDPDDPSGPAEEQDDASPDDRGLTTDLAPSD